MGFIELPRLIITGLLSSLNLSCLWNLKIVLELFALFNILLKFHRRPLMQRSSWCADAVHKDMSNILRKQTNFGATFGFRMFSAQP